jgi:hypothetical protein
VVAVKVTDVLFAGTVTVDGTPTTAEFAELSLTTRPDGPTSAFRVNVPFEDVPALTVEGLKVTPIDEAGVTVNAAEEDAFTRMAVTVAVVLEATPTVVAVNVALLELAAMVTFDGTVTELEELESTIVVAEAGFGEIVTVPVVEVPPETVLEVSATVSLSAEVGAPTSWFCDDQITVEPSRLKSKVGVK